jgi:hypothetical protein
MSETADNDNLPGEDSAVRIFIFKSEASPNLRAFSDDLVGSKLPQQFAPWRSTGALAPGKDPPHGFDRNVIEKAIRDAGFQIWRLKPAN